MQFYVELDKYVKDMTPMELRQYFPEGTSIAYLMRSIIMNEKEFTSITGNRSLRHFWYKTVKPTLDKLDLLSDADQTEEGLTKWDAELSRYMGDLLRKGLITYKDLHIIDNSRQRHSPSNMYDVPSLQTYGYKISICPYSNIIIATEKDTVFNYIQDIAELFGCSCISSKGQNSLGAMEDLIRNMSGRFDEIFVFTMTDYDPSGYYIADALVKQVDDITYALGLNVRTHIKRIGITPDQLSPEMVQQNKYTPKLKNIEKWMELTNGINGEMKGLELDALDDVDIRRIFVNNIKDYINPEVYNKFLKSSYIRKIILETLEPKIESLITDILDEHEDDLKLVKFDIFDLAVQGYSSLPIEKLCTSNLDKTIKNKALSYFKQ